LEFDTHLVYTNKVLRMKGQQNDISLYFELHFLEGRLKFFNEPFVHIRELKDLQFAPPQQRRLKRAQQRSRNTKNGNMVISESLEVSFREGEEFSLEFDEFDCCHDKSLVKKRRHPDETHTLIEVGLTIKR